MKPKKEIKQDDNFIGVGNGQNPNQKVYLKWVAVAVFIAIVITLILINK